MAWLQTDLQASQKSIKTLRSEAAHSAAMFTQFTKALRDNAGWYKHITIAENGAVTERLQGRVARLGAAVARLGSCNAGGQLAQLVEALAAQEGLAIFSLL